MMIPAMFDVVETPLMRKNRAAIVSRGNYVVADAEDRDRSNFNWPEEPPPVPPRRPFDWAKDRWEW